MGERVRCWEVELLLVAVELVLEAVVEAVDDGMDLKVEVEVDDGSSSRASFTGPGYKPARVQRV